MAKTLILGLGNPIMADDGVGWAVAREVYSRARGSADGEEVDLVEAAVAGLTAIDLLHGYDRVIIMDAILTGLEPPGHLHCLNLDDLFSTPRLASPHDVSLAHAMSLARSLGQPMPEQVSIYAVEVEDPYSFGERLTPEVERAVAGIVERIVAAEFVGRPSNGVSGHS